MKLSEEARVWWTAKEPPVAIAAVAAAWAKPKTPFADLIAIRETFSQLEWRKAMAASAAEAAAAGIDDDDEPDPMRFIGHDGMGVFAGRAGWWVQSSCTENLSCNGRLLTFECNQVRIGRREAHTWVSTT